jgi:hypothetical protein
MKAYLVFIFPDTEPVHDSRELDGGIDSFEGLRGIIILDNEERRPQIGDECG